MKKYLLLFFLQGWFVAGMAQGSAPEATDSMTFYLHKFAQNIGKETYSRRVSDSGISYSVRFKFVDRGQAVPLDARLMMTKDDEPLSLLVKGKDCRFCTIYDSVIVRDGRAWVRVGDSSYNFAFTGAAFPVAGYSPGTVQMALLQYWRRHGRPASLRLLPTGNVKISQVGYDTLAFSGRPLVLERTVINGLIWGNELVWTDAQGNLVCLITNDAEGDKLEMMLDKYEGLLPELIGRAATYAMQLFVAGMEGDAAESKKVAGSGKNAGAPAGAFGQPGTLAIVGGRMIDVATGKSTDDAVILISGGKILKTGTKTTVPVPAGAKIIHAEGKTILPGLWDMHAHFEQAEWGPAYLAAGVTTVRDCGNEFNYINAVKRAIDEGQGVGPHILKAGIIDGPGPLGLGVIRAYTPQQAVAVVRRYKDSGFVQIKIYSSVTPPVVKAICDEAHRLGMTVTGHIPEGMNLIQGVDSGMDMVNHIEYVGSIVKWKDRQIVWNDSQTVAALDFIKDHGVVLDPTLGVFEMIFRSLSDSITKMEPAFYTLPEPLQVLFKTMGMPAATAAKYKPYFRDLERLVKVLHDKGVPIVAGTDMGFPGFSVDRELELYVEAGLTPLEALRTATVVPALVMKQAGVSGSLLPGRAADIIIVEGDPVHHISDIRRVKVVIKDGKVYDPAVLHKMAGFGG
jgi:imidazolonepropionase-like amidohydrolase